MNKRLERKNADDVLKSTPVSQEESQRENWRSNTTSEYFSGRTSFSAYYR